MSELRASSFTKGQYEKALASPNMKLVHLTVREPEHMGCITISGPLPSDIAQVMLDTYIKHTSGKVT